MKDADDPIPAPCPEDTIFVSEAFNRVYQALNPDFQILKERLNPASTYYAAFQEKDAKDRANLEAWNNYDNAQRRANEWLREKLSQGSLTALVRDPDNDRCLKYNRHRWASMSVFETGIADDFFGPDGDTFQSGPNTAIRGERRPVFFDRKEFDNVVREIATPDGDTAAHPDESAPTASKARPKQQQQVLDIYQQLFPNGYTGLAQMRDNAIISEFERRHGHKVGVRTIQRALKSLKSD
jgi:hypothetical protein